MFLIIVLNKGEKVHVLNTKSHILCMTFKEAVDERNMPPVFEFLHTVTSLTFCEFHTHWALGFLSLQPTQKL